MYEKSIESSINLITINVINKKLNLLKQHIVIIQDIIRESNTNHGKIWDYVLAKNHIKYKINIYETKKRKTWYWYNKQNIMVKQTKRLYQCTK